MMRTSFGPVGLPLLSLLFFSGLSQASQCGDDDDPFTAFYGDQGIGKQWHISMVAPDHEDHGMHLSEGDSFVLQADANCEVVLIPGPLLGQRWGSALQQFGRESKVVDHSSISNELCTTMGLGHEFGTTGAIVARPHLVRLRMLDTEDGPRLEIRYGHRSSMADTCSNDGLLDGIHNGIAHAED